VVIGSQVVRTALAVFPALFARDFRTLFPRFIKADRDRLLSTFHFSTGTAFQRALLFAVHGRLHTFTRPLAIFRHGPAVCKICAG